MKFAAFFVAVAATLFGFAASAELPTTDSANPLHAPLAAADVKAGTPYTINWSPTAGNQVTLILRKGNPGSLDTIEIIAKDLPNTGAFVWTPSPLLLGDDDYAIQITSSSPLTSNYSPQFRIESKGKGIPPTSTLQPTQTLVAPTTISRTATYTGDSAKPTDAEEIEDLREAGVDVAEAESAAGIFGAKMGVVGVAFVAVAGALL